MWEAKYCIVGNTFKPINTKEENTALRGTMRSRKGEWFGKEYGGGKEQVQGEGDLCEAFSSCD